MRRIKLLIPAGIILGVVGGLVFSWCPILGVSLSLVGVSTAIYTWWASESKAKEHENFMEAQTVLLAQGGLGNAITESVNNELRKGEWTKNVAARLRRALEITPDDVQTLELLSMTLALVLSYRSWVLRTEAGSRFREAVADAKRYAERGCELAPQSHLLLTSLGMLCGLEGDHERARECFRRGGELGQGPYWRLHASTSWGMEGKYAQALTEVEKAGEEGAKGWIVPFYHGRVLASLERYDEAFPYLRWAYQARGLRPELLQELDQAAYFSGRVLTAAKYQWLLGLAMLRLGNPRRGFLALLQGTLTASFGILGTLSKKVWRYTRRVPVIGRLHGRVLPPKEPEDTILHILAERGEYEAALVLARHALRSGPYDPDNHEILLMLLVNTGNRDEAIGTCDRAIERWPDHPRFRALRRTIAETDYVFRVIPLPSGGRGWQVVERSQTGRRGGSGTAADI